jgi:hypothetical protein
VYPSNSPWPYPVGVACIAGLFFFGAAMRLFSLRSPWGLAFCGLYIVLGVGLLKMYQWARIATVVFAVLDVANYGFVLVRGFRYWHLMFSLNVFSMFLLYVLIACYLLSSNTRQAFTQPVRDPSALAEKK